MRIRANIAAFVFVVAALVAPAAWAQTNITSTQCASIDVTEAATVGMQVTGTWSGTLQPQITIQSATTRNLQVAPSTSSTLQSTITANGAYVATVAGGTMFFLCGNTVASGTAVVYLNISPAFNLTTITTPTTLTGTSPGAPVIGGNAGGSANSSATLDVTALEAPGVGDACARIAAGQTAGSLGIVLDGRGFTGAQACALSPLPNASVSDLFLGPTLFQVHQTWCIPTKVHIYGEGWDANPSSGVGATTLQATSDLAIGGAHPGPIIAWGNPTHNCWTGLAIQNAMVPAFIANRNARDATNRIDRADFTLHEDTRFAAASSSNSSFLQTSQT